MADNSFKISKAKPGVNFWDNTDFFPSCGNGSAMPYKLRPTEE